MLALLSALVLIGNTMTTLVGEQTREIGAMKAIGGTTPPDRGHLPAHRTAARRDRLARSASRSGSRWRTCWSTSSARRSSRSARGFGRRRPHRSLASLLLGLLGPPLAALPAIRRGVRVPVREALETTGSITGGSAARRPRAAALRPPAPHGPDRRAQRRPPQAAKPRDGPPDRVRRGNAARRARARHVGLEPDARGLVAIIGWQVWLGSSLQPPLDARADALIRSTPGVAGCRADHRQRRRGRRRARLRLGDRAAQTLVSLPASPTAAGTAPADERTRARVAVVESAIARAAGTEVGDRVAPRHRRGPRDVHA